MSCSRYNPRGYDVRLELHGATDSVAAGLDDGLPLRSVEPGCVPGRAAAPVLHGPPRRSVPGRAGAFAEVVAGTRPSPCTVDDALAVAWIAEAATVSLREHRPVRIEEMRVRSGGPG